MTTQTQSERARAEAVIAYARHSGLCGIIGGYGSCTCGLDDALAAFAATPPNDGGDGRMAVLGVARCEIQRGQVVREDMIGDDGTGSLVRYAQALLATPDTVTVPRVATEAMLEAGADQLFGAADDDWKVDAREIYEAMIAAAPTSHESAGSGA